MIEILPGVFVTPAKAVEIHAALGRVLDERLGSSALGLGVPLQVIDHALVVWPSGEPKLSSSRLAELLARRMPNRYAGWQGPDVSRALLPYRRQVWINGQNFKGFWRNDLEAASCSRPS